MRVFFSNVFERWMTLCCCIVVLHQISQKIFGINLPYIDSYLDPLLFMPILLQFLLWEKRIVFNKGYDFVFSIEELIVYFLLLSLISEILFPFLNDFFVADPMDVICYGLGTVLFSLFVNMPHRAS